MKKSFLFIISILFICLSSISISSEIDYKVVSVKDKSYADVRRETIRVKT